MKTQPITHIILDTTVTDDRYFGDYDYCLVPMTLEYVAKLLKYMAQARRIWKADNHVSCVERWDNSGRYLGFNDKMESLRDIHGTLLCDVSGEDPILLNGDPQFPETAFSRVECQALHVSHDGLWYSTYIKNSNVRLETSEVSRKTLCLIRKSFNPT